MKPKIPTVVIPKATKPVRAKKPAKAKVRAKKQPKPARVIGAPPADMSPPDIRDSRPKRTPLPKPSSTGQDPRLGDPGALDQAAPPTHPSPPAKQPPVPAIPVQLTGRIVQGQNCIWLGDLGETKDNGNGQPVCPHCGGFLLTIPDVEIMNFGLRRWELGAYESINPPARPHPGYVNFIGWTRKQNRCWPDIELAAEDYFKETGIRVEPK